MLKIEDIRPTTKKLFGVPGKEIDALESSLWVTFPEGYRDYMAKLGDGVLGGFIRIYTPGKIERELQEWRQRINKHWFWDRGKKLLPKERALECVIVGDTTSGDELVFHPSRPNTLFVLPGESEQVYETGGTLLAAIDWIGDSGKLTERITEWNFEPYDSNKEAKKAAKKAGKEDPPGESIDEIVKLGRAWINRHSAAKHVKKMLKDFLDAGEEGKLIHEGVGWAQNEPAYIAVFKIKDKATGRVTGVIELNTKDGIYGGGERLM